MNRCIFALSSSTYAYKGKDALQSERIKSRVVRLEQGETRRGCRYGLSVDCRDRARAASVLLSVGVIYSEILQ